MASVIEGGVDRDAAGGGIGNDHVLHLLVIGEDVQRQRFGPLVDDLDGLAHAADFHHNQDGSKSFVDHHGRVVRAAHNCGLDEARLEIVVAASNKLEREESRRIQTGGHCEPCSQESPSAKGTRTNLAVVGLEQADQTLHLLVTDNGTAIVAGLVSIQCLGVVLAAFH